MHILLVKTSSLGDVIHNLPVASDIHHAFPTATIDWCVEESFADIPALHPAVRHVTPVALRRWRKNIFDRQIWCEIRAFKQQLQAQRYDWIIDTQGLLKSALMTRLARGRRAGYSADVAREPLASHMYDATFFVPKTLHAVERNRRLAAAVLGHTVSPELDYGITATPLVADWLNLKLPYVVLLTATSRDDKLWPEDRWVALGGQLYQLGMLAVLPSGSTRERERAQRIAALIPHAVSAPRLDITSLAGLLTGAQSVVGVDTGLTHLAAALGTTTLALYTATDPGLTGVLGGTSGTGRFRNLGGKDASPSLDAVVAAGKALGAW